MEIIEINGNGKCIQDFYLIKKVIHTFLYLLMENEI